jgi:hypothetical protein
MTAPIPIPHHSLKTRRSILIGAAASLLSAPAIGPLILCRCAACHFRMGLNMQGSSTAYFFTRSKIAWKQVREQGEPASNSAAVQFQ